jgi:hypothetical protein
MLARTIALSIAMVAVGATLVSAAPTPVPGGANQIKALSGAIGSTVFNGVLRVKIVELRDATSADDTKAMNVGPNQKVMIMSSLLRNGSHDEFTDLLQYTLADKDDVTVEIPDNEVTHANLHIAQAGAEKQTGMVVIDNDFKPIKLILTCRTCSAKSAFKAIRFTIPASK